MDLEEIQKRVYEEYLKNGYKDIWTKENEQDQRIADLGEVGLFVSEIAEAQEIIRGKDKDEDLGIELADIIIRVLNFASRKNIDIESKILEKNIKNIKREKLHGRKV